MLSLSKSQLHIQTRDKLTYLQTIW